jgi:phage recombination protein Bet
MTEQQLVTYHGDRLRDSKMALQVSPFNEEQLEIIKSQIAKNCTNEELGLFVQVCKKTGLDPFSKQIYAIKRRSKNTDGSWGETMTIQTGIDGLRVLAQRGGKYRSQTLPLFCGADGNWTELWLASTPPLAAKVGIYTTDFPEPLYAIALYKTYAQMYDGKPSGLWAKMPEVLLAKCFDSETEVLTEKGFVRFSEIRAERIMQVTPGGLEAVTAKPWAQKYHGNMVKFDSDDLNFCVTPNHDMITDAGRCEASVLYHFANTRTQIRIPRIAPNCTPDAPISHDRIKLAAAYLADGYDSSGRSFHIKVSKQRKIDFLTGLNLHQNNYTENKRSGVSTTSAVRAVRTQNDYQIFLYAREDVAWIASSKEELDFDAVLKLSRQQARIFVETLIECDGHTNKKTGVKRFYSSRLSYIRLFEIAAIQAGMAVSPVRERTSDISDRPNFFVTVSDRNFISLKRWQGGPKNTGIREHRSIDLVPYSGDVWCVTVPSSTIIVRRAGFSMICGNCAEALALRKACPNDTNQLYVAEEMQQADVEENPWNGTEGRATSPALEALPPAREPEIYTETPQQKRQLQKICLDNGVTDKAQMVELSKIAVGIPMENLPTHIYHYIQQAAEFGDA